MTVEHTNTPEIIKNHYQAIVVGSGPTGAVCAAKLAENGISVLLIDHQEFPRDKTCGDGVSDAAISIINNIPSAKEEIEDSKFNQITHVLIGSPNGKELKYPVKGENYIIPRLILDNLVRNLALKQGAETLTARVTDLIFDENNGIKGIVAKKGNNLHDIYAQVVIGADGATSTVARKLGLEKHPENQSAVAIRAYVDGIKTEHTAEIYLWESILPGYAWVFPLADGKANIGVGMRTDKYKETNSNLQNMLDLFVLALKEKDRLDANFDVSEIAQWPLPMAVKIQEQSLAFNGAVLIGDAARMINPITGGGINSGVESAMIAADVIIKLLQKTNNSLTKEQLKDYEERVKKQLGGTMQKATMAANLIGNYPIIANIATLVGNLPIINEEIAKLFKNL